MELVKGIIEDRALVNGRVDLRVERADGITVRYEGVVLYDDKTEPIDLWTKAEVFVEWREKIGQLDEKERPRVAVLVVKVPGGSTTKYIEPGDRIVSVCKHGRVKLLRLLYVEDDKTQAAAQIRWLMSRGCEVFHVNSSKAAIEKMDTEVFHAIVTDWNLLGSDTGAPVVREALRRGYPVRVWSGLLVAEHADIWICKSRPEEIDRFLTEVRG